MKKKLKSEESENKIENEYWCQEPLLNPTCRPYFSDDPLYLEQKVPPFIYENRIKCTNKCHSFPLELENLIVSNINPYDFKTNVTFNLNRGESINSIVPKLLQTFQTRDQEIDEFIRNLIKIDDPTKLLNDNMIKNIKAFFGMLDFLVNDPNFNFHYALTPQQYEIFEHRVILLIGHLLNNSQQFVKSFLINNSNYFETLILWVLQHIKNPGPKNILINQIIDSNFLDHPKFFVTFFEIIAHLFDFLVDDVWIVQDMKSEFRLDNDDHKIDINRIKNSKILSTFVKHPKIQQEVINKITYLSNRLTNRSKNDAFIDETRLIWIFETFPWSIDFKSIFEELKLSNIMKQRFATAFDVLYGEKNANDNRMHGIHRILGSWDLINMLENSNSILSFNYPLFYINSIKDWDKTNNRKIFRSVSFYEKIWDIILERSFIPQDAEEMVWDLAAKHKWSWALEDVVLRYPQKYPHMYYQIGHFYCNNPNVQKSNSTEIICRKGYSNISLDV